MRFCLDVKISPLDLVATPRYCRGSNQSKRRRLSSDIKTESILFSDGDDSDCLIINDSFESTDADDITRIDLEDINHSADALRMSQAVQSTDICPLSGEKMTTPLRSTVCGHTFDRQSILNHIQSLTSSESGSVECPRWGCFQTLKKSDFVNVPVIRDGEWQCAQCTYINQVADSMICAECESQRKYSNENASRETSASHQMVTEYENVEPKRQE